MLFFTPLPLKLICFEKGWRAETGSKKYIKACPQMHTSNYNYVIQSEFLADQIKINPNKRTQHRIHSKC